MYDTSITGAGCVSSCCAVVAVVTFTGHAAVAGIVASILNTNASREPKRGQKCTQQALVYALARKVPRRNNAIHPGQPPVSQIANLTNIPNLSPKHRVDSVGPSL